MHARRNLLDGVNGRIPAEERIAPFRAPIVSAALKEQRNRARQMRMFLWDKSRARIGIDAVANLYARSFCKRTRIESDVVNVASCFGAVRKVEGPSISRRLRPKWHAF